MTLSDAALIAGKMETGDAKDAFLILRGTGMRPSETFSMSWDNVKWETAQYQNPRGKTKSARRPVPLLNDSFTVLRRRYLAQGMPREGRGFPSDSKSGHMVTIAKAFTKARDAAGVPKIYVRYSSRHGAMTDLCRIVPLSEAMNIGGHSDAKTAIRIPTFGDAQATGETRCTPSSRHTRPSPSNGASSVSRVDEA
jgi:integrase